jgi:hypothetical protein
MKQKTTGDIGGLEVTLTIEGDDEQLANLIYADIVGRLDEIKQMLDEDIPPEGTHPPMSADWEAYYEGDI